MHIYLVIIFIQCRGVTSYRKKNSGGWLHKGDRAFCRQKVAHDGGTMNLKYHLLSNHRREYLELFPVERNPDL